MKPEIIDATAVRDRMSMRQCIEAMATAMTSISTREVSMPPRIIMPLVDHTGFLGVMPGATAKPPVYGAKIISLHPRNPEAGRPTIQGFVALFDHDTGEPFALVDGAEITAMRTAAVSALATRLLARADARSLGILGCGVQASSHLQAIGLVRDIEEVRVWARAHEKAQVFSENQADQTRMRVRPVASAEEAASADVVCVVTGSHEPVIRGAWVRPGAHVNLVGAHTSTTREADSALIAEGRVYVDSIDAALKDAGDILIPIQEAAIDSSHVVGEIGAVLLGQISGRRNIREVTVFKSLGLVAQDLVAAYTVTRARQR